MFKLNKIKFKLEVNLEYKTLSNLLILRIHQKDVYNLYDKPKIKNNKNIFQINFENKQF